MDILVTNNPLVKNLYDNEFQVDFIETDLSGVLIHVRDLIHKGHKLLTHPLSGSIKPNENIYKSVIISDTTKITDLQSVTIIEECIITAKKFPVRQISEQFMQDMQMIDLSLISSAYRNR